MAEMIHQLKTKADKLQGTMGRLAAKIPEPILRAGAKALGFNQKFSALDPQLQVLVAIRSRMGGTELVGKNHQKNRHVFRKEAASIVSKPTEVANVSDFVIDINSAKIAVRHYTPDIEDQTNNTEKKLPLLVFFHGGGFVIGDLDTHDEPCRLLCQHAQVQVLSVDYRLAPEHPAPTAVDDCLAALKWAYDHAAELNVDPTKIAVGGDSAGGNLSAVVSQLSKGTAYAPAAQLLIYPVVDLQNEYPSHAKYGEGLFLSQADMSNIKDAYISHSNLALSDPRVSPILGDLAGLAPALLITAEFDTLRDEGELYAIKMREAGSHCTAYRVNGQGHGIINFTPINHPAFKATVKIAHDFKALLDGHVA
jgi:acetyl esterase